MTQEQLEAALQSLKLRREVSQTLEGFTRIYFGHLLSKNWAPFHRTLFHALTDPKEKRTLILGFRSSGKSTISNTIFTLWSALEGKSHFIVLCSDTGKQAKINFRNIKHELENNELLISDYGIRKTDIWQVEDIVLQNNVRILARSRSQKVRGFRHGKYRPDLIIVDDPEDIEWVRQKENRDKTERWIREEVLPAGATEKRVVLIGNLLHADCLLARMMKQPSPFKEIRIPLLDDQGICQWPADFPTAADLKAKEDEVGYTAWNREYLLKIVPEEGQVIKPSDIHYYDEIPEYARSGTIVHGVDLAISKSQHADYTAVVTGTKYRIEKKARLLIHPGAMNRRMDFLETMQTMKVMNVSPGMHMFFVENVGYQKAAIETMKQHQLTVIPMQPVADKRARLMVAATFIKDGTVLFPRRGSEELLNQIFGFGVEEHDDMVDALTYVILGTVTDGLDLTRIVYSGD